MFTLEESEGRGGNEKREKGKGREGGRAIRGKALDKGGKSCE